MRTAFLRNEEKKEACLTRIVMIGEYSARISDNLKDKFTDVEWQLMKSTRNYYVHVLAIDWIRKWIRKLNEKSTINENKN